MKPKETKEPKELATPATPPTPTPETTPIPGGGSWRWTGEGWAPNEASTDPITSITPAPSATPE